MLYKIKKLGTVNHEILRRRKKILLHMSMMTSIVLQKRQQLLLHCQLLKLRKIILKTITITNQMKLLSEPVLT